MPYKNIFVSLDGSENEKRVVQEAVRLASLCQARLSVVHVNDPPAGKAHMMMGGCRSGQKRISKSCFDRSDSKRKPTPWMSSL
ncbi:universal stress protein [bacterium]|nr:universal stress protein [bacterium]